MRRRGASGACGNLPARASAPALRLALLLAGFSSGGFSSGCGDDAQGTGGAGAGTASSTSSSSSASTTSVTTTSAGGAGGGDDSRYCWEGCPEDQPACEDGYCVATCAADRDLCETSLELSCCEPGTVCCDLPAPGLAGCGTVCEVTCPDEVTVCTFGTLCEVSPADETWSCTPVDGCQPERQCGDACCPLGSRCTDGECLLPNLRIDEEVLATSIVLGLRGFSANACELPEGCIDAPGFRRLLRFDLKTPNVGEGDLFLGKPCADPDDPDPACADADLFQFENCHGHAHFTTYAGYRLLDEGGEVAAAGHKQAFCLLDFLREDGPPGAIYHCGYQGIQAGWADVYTGELPCQWVDVTDVPPGDYRLEVTLNTERLLAESNFEDNIVTVDVHIGIDSCPIGCDDPDPVACQPGDPLGKADDGTCDCYGLHEWDAADCGDCEACAVTSCPGGCQADEPACCGALDDCALAENGVCNCSGAAPWDAADCDACVSADVDCPPIDSCPNGCGPTEPECPLGVVPAWQGDGACDCGAADWDALDCFSCAAGCE